MMYLYRKLPLNLFSKSQRCFSSSQQLTKAFQKYYKRNEPLKGYCTPQGSKFFSQRNKSIHSDYWKTPMFLEQQLYLSSLGLGTQNGDPTPQVDIKQFQAIVTNLENGKINMLDTDVNFRYGKSQKTINTALNYLINEKSLKREEIFVATKCGYIMQDIDSQLDENTMRKIILEEKYATKDDIVNQIYCLSKDFIKFSIEKSRLSLGLDTIDLVYLNNPIEAMLPVLGKDQMYKRLSGAFETLEQLRTLNAIRSYGIASFVSFRSPPTQEGIHGSLTQIAEIARKVGGQNHGLKFCLIPLNLGMPEGLLQWQKSKDNTKQLSIFEAAKESKININICCPLFQGRLVKIPFGSTLLNNIKSTSSKHLQLIRSIDQKHLVSTIFGSLSKEHCQQNLQITTHRKLTGQEWSTILPMPPKK